MAIDPAPVDPNKQVEPVAHAVDIPGVAVTAGTLSKGAQLVERRARVDTKNIKLNEKDIVNVAMPSASEVTSAKARALAGPTSFGYVGTNLVSGDGSITRGQYNAKAEAFGELAKIKDPAARITFLKSLQSRGLYNGGKVSSTGLDSQDLGAMEVFLNFANVQGVTSDVAINQLQTMFPSAGGGRTIRTTAATDIRAVFKNATRSILGRDLNPDEIEKFVKSYQGKEIVEGQGGAKAPTIANAAEEAVMQQNSGEANAMGMSNLMDLMDKKIKGLA
jgi:hypothetical protein